MKIRVKFNSFFFMGLLLILIAIYFFAPKYFTTPSSLICIEESITNVKTVYNPVIGWRGMESIKAELLIKMGNHNSSYSLSKNIGNDLSYPKFEEIRIKLEHARNAKIWIKKSEHKEDKPEVYQIARNKDEMLYSLKEAKQLSRNGLVGCVVLGLIFIFLSDSKYTHNSYIQSKGKGINNKPLNLVNSMLILFFGYLTYFGIKYRTLEIAMLFGGITLMLIVTIIYFNIKEKAHNKP